MEHVSVDLDAVRTWLELLHGQSDGLIHVCSAGNWQGQVCETVDQAVSYVKLTDLRNPSGIYVRATTLRERPEQFRRGGESNSACLPAVWGDIDIAGPGHKTTKPLVPDEATALQLIETSGLPTPSIWVRSGGGMYPWWLLDQPRCLTSPDEEGDLQWLLATWQDVIAHAAEKLGFFYGTECKDLARVLRIPGTVNRKVPDDPRLCHVADNLGSGNTWTVDDLYDAAVTELPKLHRPERTILVPRVVVPGAPDESPGDALESVPWDDPLLLGSDWQLHHQIGATCYWTRPGKSRRDGYSATTGYDPGRDRMFVFSSSTPLPVDEPLTKFAVHAYLSHGGDFSAAAAHLRKIGLGGHQFHETEVEPWSPELPSSTPDEPVTPTQPVAETQAWRKFSWDDIGNGERFEQRYGSAVRWLVDAEQWAIRTGGRWKKVSESPLDAMAQQLIQDLPRLEAEAYSEEAEVAQNGKAMPSERDLFMKWVAKQRMDSRVRAMISRAKAQLNLHAESKDFDQDPMLLNCKNGVLDLRNATLLPHGPDQLFMERAGTSWDETAQCPRWMTYLEKTIPNEEERAYLQRIAGYCLTGDISEQSMFIHHGFGANGKSVFLEVLGKVMGSYSIVIDSSTLMAKNYEGTHNADVARMAGKRLLRTSETNVGKRLDEGQVKLLTGGDDAILARFPYQRYPFEFWPTGKINLGTNHAPNVSNADSIWRRIKLIGWDVVIQEHERDKQLAKKILATEAPGVLAWAVQGCLEWQRRGGLDEPLDSKARVSAYRVDQDVLADFLFDCVREVPHFKETSTQAYQMYRIWCDLNGVRSMAQKSFVMALEERGFKRYRDMHARGFVGIRVVHPSHSEIEGI